MATLLVHLSDVHLTKDDDSFVNRSQKIADAALSAVTNYEQIHVVVSGDLVQSGQSAEFGVAKKFLAALKAAIEAKANASVHFVLAPGNHECDFTGSQNVRDRLLSGVKGVAEDFEPEIAAEYSRVLSNFFEFREEMSPGVDTKSPWLALYKNCGGSGINYVVLSSSVLSTKSEKQGALFVPVPKSSDISIEGGLTIYVMHHPYNWLSPDNARELAQFAAVSANIFLMGHEHVSVSQKISDLYEDSSVYYLKAHVLKDSKRFLDSEFQTVEIDGEQGFLVRKYRLDGGAYCQVASSEAEKHIAWRQKSTKGPVLAEDAYRRLMDPGANFSHRLKSSLTLPDIYMA
ncbi:metallophosphoesterase [Lysobacter sp. Root983]|uniref:metallophosphoesterase family protein n=1 Tax=Lysobacter sp. Root983 TaxID=1736613 RepID=UPI0009E99A1D|nr:metallophosphoesterase [Lysobacter sp. Root983]